MFHSCNGFNYTDSKRCHLFVLEVKKYSAQNISSSSGTIHMKVDKPDCELLDLLRPPCYKVYKGFRLNLGRSMIMFRSFFTTLQASSKFWGGWVKISINQSQNSNLHFLFAKHFKLLSQVISLFKQTYLDMRSLQLKAMWVANTKVTE